MNVLSVWAEPSGVVHLALEEDPSHLLISSDKAHKISENEVYKAKEVQDSPQHFA